MQLIDITQLLCDTEITVSRAQARRMIAQGGVMVDDLVSTEVDLLVSEDSEIKIKQRQKIDLLYGRRGVGVDYSDLKDLVESIHSPEKKT